jgi:hypothetical protein
VFTVVPRRMEVVKKRRGGTHWEPKEPHVAQKKGSGRGDVQGREFERVVCMKEKEIEK